ncbi:hypothetical protein AB0O91_13845 [Kitasatospora sp. NPDC089797]|uniref:hypothetical protein n=1 Tax=Kitasatospora sp. NPDC089797 TaxID=3155298 RepID=UPI00342FEE26
MKSATHTSLTRPRPGRAVTAATIAIAALALNACGVNTLQERSKPTMTLDQARKQIDGYQRDILAKLPVTPASNPTSFDDLECDANDIGPHGRKQTWRSADFDDLPLTRRAEVADAFRTFLTGQGFQSVEPGHGWVKMKNPKDDFVALLDGTGDAERTFQLTVSSPCLWPDGTPPK